jgi:hypothetical protein
MQAAEKMYEELEGWYDRHPEASFGEIEAEVRKQRRKLMGKTLEEIVNGRDVGVQIEAPKCAECGAGMGFEGYCGWNIHGLEGDSRLERAYYVCPNCPGQTLFPPGSEVEITLGPLERRRGTGGSTSRTTIKILP